MMTMTHATTRVVPRRAVGEQPPRNARRRPFTRVRAGDGDIGTERDVFDDRSLAPARRRAMRDPYDDGYYDEEPRGGRAPRREGRGGGASTPAPVDVAKAMLSPFGAFVIAAIVSVANPGFMTAGREAILMRIYERENGNNVEAYVRDGTLFRMDERTGVMTANAKNGLMVDPRGGIWVIVPQKFDETLIKEKYYMGQIQDVPPLGKNPSAAEKKRYDEYMTRTFKPLFDDLPDLKKVYDGPYPVPLRKETREFMERGGGFGDSDVVPIEISK
mmetsp:Transcript_3690/g.7957  ORF Transcript_3690/g.7957 Transcript_3690/m.7957 type:complete len:273 (-) Transcript_3690:51-869(-)